MGNKRICNEINNMKMNMKIIRIERHMKYIYNKLKIIIGNNQMNINE